ncbi:hypothetical protein GCK72_017962 [Caenorhabditis remanei]|uniref:HAT C-terminal dimerisation domain-containing protein n=1 Tax=Caenorhabditis remanei TaxID=31234 RepID=A0A6A5G8K4_CAERE|nr:hypothetical protein GCK72_017962 [Caenorhabditis remanei]KAF1751408.1 hypothetical protein GCK72_017962 [Caenorhabditis remanei]
MKFQCCQCGILPDKAELIQIPNNASTLNKWIRKFNLKLINVQKNKVQYICRKHVQDEKVVEKLPYEPTTPSSSEFEVKQEEQEIVHQEDRNSNLWVDPKEEYAEEVNYDDLELEMQQESYSTYEEDEQQKNYEMDCQPTTSTASYSSSSQCENSQNGTDLSNLRLCFPELSDEQIMIFCVKTSSNISGETSLECGMCAEQYFNNTDTRPIRIHLEAQHLMLVQNFIKTGRASLAPKSYSPLTELTRMNADQELCKFLIANGLPLSSVKDRNLEMLVFNMNSSYTLPPVDTLYEHLRIFASIRTKAKIRTDPGPITVSFDTTMYNNKNYLAFTVHYYQKNKKQQIIYLREFEITQPMVSSIISAIKNSLDESNIRAPITTVVSGKAEYEESLEAINSFKQVMVCFSQNINKFAEALIELPVFSDMLAKIRSFITKLPSNRNTWGRFKAFLVRKRSHGEYPEIDNGHWFTTVDFLTKCLHMHKLFSDFLRSQTHSQSQGNYIAVEDNVNMVYLHSLLNYCKTCLSTMVDSNATIADVIPSIMDMHATLDITTSNQKVIDAVHMLFNRLLLPFVEQSDIHRFALFLHPLRHGNSVLPTNEWNRVRSAISRHLSLREATEGTPINELGQMSGLPSYQDALTVDKEVAQYSAYVARTSGVESEVMDWWTRHATRFPRLYKYARELFQIPAFSIDAAFYLGDYGLITNSLSQTDPSKQKMLLQASSELVDFRSKGDVMSKTICVKRKREVSNADDMWYTPLDMKALLACDANDIHDGTRRLLQKPQTSMFSQAALSKNRIFTPPSSVQNRQYTLPPAPGRSWAEEIAKVATRPVPQKTYHLANNSPYSRPVVIRKAPALLEPKQESTSLVEPKAEPPVMHIPVSTRKYYAVRTVPAPGQKIVRSVNGKVLQVVRARAPMTATANRIGITTAPQQSKKVYFVRTKTGVTQLQAPP